MEGHRKRKDEEWGALEGEREAKPKGVKKGVKKGTKEGKKEEKQCLARRQGPVLGVESRHCSHLLRKLAGRQTATAAGGVWPQNFGVLCGLGRGGGAEASSVTIEGAMGGALHAGRGRQVKQRAQGKADGVLTSSYPGSGLAMRSERVRVVAREGWECRGLWQMAPLGEIESQMP